MSLLGPQLDAFIAVAKHKTVHSASAVLYITQTAVTQRVRNLENRLKVSLFTRTRRGMQITPEGESLLQYCQATAQLEGELLAKLDSKNKQTQINLTLCAHSSIMRARIIPACLPLMKKNPNWIIHFKIEDQENRHLALKSGECDAAILQPEHVAPEMTEQKLQPERYILVCPKAWQDMPIEKIIKTKRIIDYNQADQMTFDFLKHFNLYTQANKIRYFANNTEEIVELVSQGLGYTVLTEDFYQIYADKKNLFSPIPKQFYLHHISLCYYPRPILTSCFSAITNAIQ
jgi:DNA-binding transcriptional LysR family regulator